MSPKFSFPKSVNWHGAPFLLLTPPIAIVLTVLHVRHEGFLWPIWVLAAVMYSLTVVSITAGYHRYFAHRTYDAKPWVKWFYALFGAAAFQNSILEWSRDHRVHHRFVDSNNDPYNINRGFFFAHFGWMLRSDLYAFDTKPYGRDLERDPVVMFQHKHYVWVASLMCFGFPALIGYFLGSALGGLAIGGFLRVVLVHHMTFFINSWCHYFGRQTYTDTNSAKDSLLMAIATFGEGYHNFHHYFANDYRNGVRWYHWDPTKWWIGILHWMGAAENLRRTPWTTIVKAQLSMQEKQLKEHLEHNWHESLQQQLDSLRARVEAAHAQFERLREEYKTAASDYAHAKMERLQEIKLQMRLAKIEFRAAFAQWRTYHAFLLEAQLAHT